MLGTAILIAIVGDPTSLRQALDASDNAYLFAVFASLAAGGVTLALRPAAASLRERAPAPAEVAPADR